MLTSAVVSFKKIIVNLIATLILTAAHFDKGILAGVDCDGDIWGHIAPVWNLCINEPPFN